MEERRRHQRFESSQERPFNAKQNGHFLGAVRNFARGGLSFISKEELNDKEKLNLELELEGLGRGVSLAAEILWSRNQAEGFAYGAKFNNILPEDKFDILDLLYRDWREKIPSDSFAR